MRISKEEIITIKMSNKELSEHIKLLQAIQVKMSSDLNDCHLEKFSISPLINFYVYKEK